MSDPNPYAPPVEWNPADEPIEALPEEGTPVGIWRKGKILIMRKDAVLPDRCVKTNLPAYGRRKHYRAYWQPRWLWMVAIPIYLILFGFIIPDHANVAAGWEFLFMILFGVVLIAGLLLRRKAEVEIGWSESARSKEHGLIAIRIFIFVIFMGGYFGLKGSVFRGGALMDEYGTLLLFLVLIGVSLAINFICHPLVTARIDDKHVWLKGVHPDYLDTLPEWPYN